MKNYLSAYRFLECFGCIVKLIPSPPGGLLIEHGEAPTCRNRKFEWISSVFDFDYSYSFPCWPDCFLEQIKNRFVKIMFESLHTLTEYDGACWCDEKLNKIKLKNLIITLARCESKNTSELPFPEHPTCRPLYNFTNNSYIRVDVIGYSMNNQRTDESSSPFEYSGDDY